MSKQREATTDITTVSFVLECTGSSVLLWDEITGRLSQEWEKGETSGQFQQDFNGVPEKEEHIEELLGYVENDIISILDRLEEHGEVFDGTARITINNYGVYLFSFSSDLDGDTMTEELEKHHEFTEPDDDELFYEELRSSKICKTSYFPDKKA